MTQISLRICKNLPQIQDASMHRVQKSDPSLGEDYALGVEICPKYGGHLCMGSRNMTQIQGNIMHRGWKHDSDSRHSYAQCAETWTRFMADLCLVCISLSQIRGI